MIELRYKWGERKPKWHLNASSYARNVIGIMDSADEDTWFKQELGMRRISHRCNYGGWDGVSLIFDNDSDYTYAIMRWA